MSNHRTESQSFLTPPVQIAPSGKTLKAAKKDLAGILKRIADNDFAVAKALNRTVEKKSEIDALKKQTPAFSAQEIERKREDLAAAIALGEKSSADLVAFEEKEVELAERSRDKAASLAEQIKPLEVELRGLRRRIDALNAEGAHLQEERKIAARDLCRAGFEEEGAAYIRLAHELRLIVAKVVAWGDLHRSPHLGGSSTVGAEVDRISLMPLGTDSTHNRTPFFSSNEMGPLYDAANDEILAGLAAEGLELFPPPPAAPTTEGKDPAPGLRLGELLDQLRPAEPLRTGSGHLAPAQALTEPEE